VVVVVVADVVEEEVVEVFEDSILRSHMEQSSIKGAMGLSMRRTFP
jgi:tRNA threonylcarbamoyladenosine modification (KEOPS) complex  Pcc1 subunit